MTANLKARLTNWNDNRRARHLARWAADQALPDPRVSPVIFFNASARLSGLSQNAAFALLSGWGLRLAGVPVVHFVCQSGMSHCVLGTNRQDFHQPPPCKSCVRQSRLLFTGAHVRWFKSKADARLDAELQNLNVDQLSSFEFPNPDVIHPPYNIMPLGSLVLPSIRWALRRHTLPDDEATRYLLRQYLLSAYHIIQEFIQLLEQLKPNAVIIFNGTMYPEASARWAANFARQTIPELKELRVITHEVGFQRFSAFFTEGEATAYPIPIPENFELSPEQDQRLDSYLEKRFQGKFSMAGIRFWPEMHGLDEAFLKKISQFHQVVPIFTNVVYDTSQVHANRIFPHMFAWLDSAFELISNHPETLFVIRAHPDEMRPGTAKQSRESVRDWVSQKGLDKLEHVIFIDSQEYISSYELIQRAKFVLVYNSSIGMEATLMGTPVLCGGKARYTQYPIVYFPDTPKAFRDQAEAFLSAERIDVPAEFVRNARRFLYYQLYRASLSFEDYLEEGQRKGYVRFRDFEWRNLLPKNSPAIQTILNGITGRLPADQAGADGNHTFLLEEAG